MIRKDLTREEFEALANRKPMLEGDWLYKYENSYVIGDIENIYPKFSVIPSGAYLFTEFAEAEAFMRKCVDDNARAENPKYLYRHVIRQIPVGKHEHCCGATWLYDGDGTLVDYSIVTCEGGAFDTHYFGRSTDRRRFKRGDIVEVMGRDHEVHLSVVISDAADIDWCWDYFQRILAEDNWYGYSLDVSDESCYLIDGPGYEWHEHVSPLCVMKPHFPIPDDVRAEMMSWLEAYDNPMKTDDDASPVRRYGWEIGEINETRIFMHYNVETSVPYLRVADEAGLVDYAFRIDNGEPYTDDGISGVIPDQLLNKLQAYLEEKEIGKTRWWYILRDWNDGCCDDQHISLVTPIPQLKK